MENNNTNGNPAPANLNGQRNAPANNLNRQNPAVNPQAKPGMSQKKEDNGALGNAAKVAAGVAAGVAGVFGAQAATDAFAPVLDAEGMVSNAVDLAQNLVDTEEDTSAATSSAPRGVHVDEVAVTPDSETQILNPETQFNPEEIVLNIDANGNIIEGEDIIGTTEIVEILPGDNYPDPFSADATEVFIADNNAIDDPIMVDPIFEDGTSISGMDDLDLSPDYTTSPDYYDAADSGDYGIPDPDATDGLDIL